MRDYAISGTAEKTGFSSVKSTMVPLTGLAPSPPPDALPTASEAVVAVVAPQKELRDRVAAALAADGLEVAHRGWDVADLVLERGDDPDVIVVACEVPERRAALAPVAQRLPSATIVVVAARATRQTVRRIVENGAAGLVLEDSVEVALALAVRSACAGQLSLPRELSVGLQEPVLSSREKQILGMVVMGFKNSEIAGRLFLAESTIKSHLSSVFSKLGVRSRKEAAELVLDPETGLGTGVLTISDGSDE